MRPVVVRGGLAAVSTIVSAEDEADLLRGGTKMFRFEPLPVEAGYGADESTTRIRVRRPPLSVAELTPGHFCWGASDWVSLELEVRGLLAARYDDEHEFAFARFDQADQYLTESRRVIEKATLLQQWDERNREILRASRDRYEREQSGRTP